MVEIIAFSQENDSKEGNKWQVIENLVEPQARERL